MLAKCDYAKSSVIPSGDKKAEDNDAEDNDAERRVR
jgi:hypothetical protein